ASERKTRILRSVLRLLVFEDPVFHADPKWLCRSDLIDGHPYRIQTPAFSAGRCQVRNRTRQWIEPRHGELFLPQVVADDETVSCFPDSIGVPSRGNPRQKDIIHGRAVAQQPERLARNEVKIRRRDAQLTSIEPHPQSLSRGYRRPEGDQ